MLYPKIDTIFERNEKTFKVCSDKIKNPIFSLIKEWEFTEKIDGTNIRIFKGDCLEIGGRTEGSQIPKEVESYIFDHLQITMPKLEEIFGEKDVVIYGEGYGGKIQAGENDKKRGGKYSKTEKFIVFDILVGGKYWLARSNIEEICKTLSLDVVPYVWSGSIEDAVKIVKDNPRSWLNQEVDAEGLVGRTHVPLFDAKHNRLICKIKTRDF